MHFCRQNILHHILLQCTQAELSHPCRDVSGLRADCSAEDKKGPLIKATVKGMEEITPSYSINSTDPNGRVEIN